ncbi:MAG TPA: hypothetical protein VFV25_10910 [Methylibium sp.]
MPSALSLAARRVSQAWEPGLWIGALRLAFEAGPAVQQSDGGFAPAYPAHYLVALWEPPASPLLPRWPAVAAIASPDADAALLELVSHLPAGQRVWLAREIIDWALVAEIVLRTDRNLAAYHRSELQGFIERCRASDAARIAAEYSDLDSGYEAFRQGLTPGRDP